MLIFYYSLKKNSPKNSSSYTISKLMLNSLYGRFGISPYFNRHILGDIGTAVKLSENNCITDVLPLTKNTELISYLCDEVNEFEDHNNLSSIAIAAAITSGARTYMTYFKNMDAYTLYYSDTDSIDIDKPLPQEFVGEDLGQFKLEYKFDEAVFLSPKVYGGIFSDQEIVRIKGLKNPIKLTKLKSLIKKGSSVSCPNQKWYKNLSQGQILIRDEIYTLTINDSKRELIYDTNNNFTDTRPIKL